MEKTHKNILYADYMRVLATLAVILLHCAGDLLYHFDLKNMDLVRWWTGNIYDSSVRWCVPMFVLLSGALLMRPNRVESIPDFLKKRMMRVFIPFAFWGIIYTIYTNRGYIRDQKAPYWPDIFHKIFFEDVYYHLWFVPMILGLYFLIPVFRVFVRHATRYEQEYFLVFWFYISTMQVYFPDFLIVKYIGWLSYIGYVILGDYLVNYPITEKLTRQLYALGWISLAVTIGGTWQASAHFGYFADKFYQYLSPNVIFMAVALFIGLKNYDWERFVLRFPRIHAFVKWFSGISFGVYLVHVLYLDIFKNAYLFGLQTNAEVFFNHAIHPIFGTLLLTFFITSISIITIYILDKIPFLSKITK
jgi:surface polysaccharide O-acyltransferase-like enzyme